jgi:hypothetical protein
MKIQIENSAGKVVQEVEHLSSKIEALNTNVSITKNKFLIKELKKNREECVQPSTPLGLLFLFFADSRTQIHTCWIF